MIAAFISRGGSHWRRSLVTLFLAVLVVGTSVSVRGDDEGTDEGKGLSHGLGDHIEWHTLEEGQELSAKEGKPLMLIIHKSWCGACKSLKPKFKESQEIASLSKKFVMVNTEDNEEPQGDKYKPDGGYIPRILFLDSSGNLMDITNESGNPSYKYYYFDAESVAESMKRAISTGNGKETTQGDESQEEQDEQKSNNESVEETTDATISGDDELNQDTYSTAKIEL